MTKTEMENIKNIVEDLSYDYEYVGIRAQYEEFELGEIDHVSHMWIDSEDTNEELDGVCAIRVCANVNANDFEEKYNKYFNGLIGCYAGDHVAILVGNTAEYGQDPGEVIIKDAEVAYIIK